MCRDCVRGPTRTIFLPPSDLVDITIMPLGISEADLDFVKAMREHDAILAKLNDDLNERIRRLCR